MFVLMHMLHVVVDFVLLQGIEHRIQICKCRVIIGAQDLWISTVIIWWRQ